MSVSVNPLVVATEAPPIAEAASWRRPDNFGADKPLIDVCQAVPGYVPDERLRAHVAEAALGGNSAFYTAVEGLPELRAALAADMSATYGGGNVKSEDVLISSGCNQAFFLAMMALAPAGSSVILPTPWYFNHKMTLDMLGIEAIPLPCSAENGMLPDLREATALIRQNTRAIVLVTPNNPTGAVYPHALLKEFLDLTEDHGMALVLDETYRDFLRPDAGAPHTLFSDAGWRGAGLVHLYSFSKVFSLTGYRAGALVAAPSFVNEVAKVMDCMSICAPSLAQSAALFGLGNLHDWRRDKRLLMAERVAAFSRALDGHNAGYKVRSIGAYFAYVEHPFTDQDAKTVAMRLAAEQNLLCLPGSMFGPDQERMLRFAFANVDASVMPEIANRLL